MQLDKDNKMRWLPLPPLSSLLFPLFPLQTIRSWCSPSSLKPRVQEKKVAIQGVAGFSPVFPFFSFPLCCPFTPFLPLLHRCQGPRQEAKCKRLEVPTSFPFSSPSPFSPLSHLSFSSLDFPLLVGQYHGKRDRDSRHSRFSSSLPPLSLPPSACLQAASAPLPYQSSRACGKKQ